jgi:hypothetical protein
MTGVETPMGTETPTLPPSLGAVGSVVTVIGSVTGVVTVVSPLPIPPPLGTTLTELPTGLEAPAVDVPLLLADDVPDADELVPVLPLCMVSPTVLLTSC